MSKVPKMVHCPQNCEFCISDLHFVQILALFTPLRLPTTNICLIRYILVLFCLHNHFQSIYEFRVFQMEKSLPVFYTNFGPFGAFKAPTEYLCLAKYNFWYCFVYNHFLALLPVYIIPYGKLASKLLVLYF